MPTRETVRRLTRHKAWRKRRPGPGRYAGEPLPVTFPTADLKVTVRIALGADLSQSWLTWQWLDITEWVRYRDAITITLGRQDWASRVDAGRARLRLDNRDGRFSRRNPLSPYYGLLSKNTPIWITVDPGSGESTRFQGFVTEWPTRWTDKSGTDSTVPIVCSGVIRRLESASANRSALRRSVESLSPDSFWPLEGDLRPLAGTADALAAANVGSGPLGPTTEALDFGSTRGPVGVSDAAELSYNWLVLGQVDPAATTAASFVAWVKLPSDASGSNYVQVNFNLSGSTGDVAYFYMDASPTSVSAATLEIDGVGSSSLGSTSMTVDTTTAHQMAMTIAQSGSDLVVNTYFDGVHLETTTLASDTFNAPVRVVAGNVRIDGTVPVGDYQAVVSSLAFWRSELTAAQIARMAAAGVGGVGELAHERVIRVCAEAGVALSCVSARSVVMGPQPVGTEMSVLRECQIVDDGLLFETEFGLGYTSSSERLNAPVAMALDFDSRHIAEEPEPADDDQRTVNYWVASRSGGESATAQDADSIADGLLYDGGSTVNVEADSQLIHQAGWQVHKGTVDEDRWPHLALRFHGTPDLIPDWVETRIGDRVTVDNPPEQVDPYPIDAIIEGWTEQIDTKTWQAALNTSPASPFEVFQIETGTGNRSRLDTKHSTLSAEVASGGTSATVVTAAGKRPWITSAAFPAQFPLIINIGGEPITVTDITSATSPQTFTLTRSLAKSHAAGAKVSLWRPPAIALEGRG